MELRILSLNVRLWAKENNPLKPHFWLWRTFKQARLFRRIKPDIICLQEVEKPVGRFLLGLWKYRGFDTHTRIPIYIRKDLDAISLVGFGGMPKDNGHGISKIMLFFEDKSVVVQNGHYSWDTEQIKEELKHGYTETTIFCGDTNVSRDKFISNLKKYVGLEDEDFIVYPKEPEGSTYVAYSDPSYNGDIDQFGYVGANPPKAEVTILPDKVSDHFPILATIEI